MRRVARIIPFDPTMPRGGPPWGRYPRFQEVASVIASHASDLFDTDTSLRTGQALYAELERRLTDESDRTLLRQLHDALQQHHGKYEHAAYLVGMLAGMGRLTGLPPSLPDDRREPQD